jgi:arginine exporter protein ArgO
MATTSTERTGVGAAHRDYDLLKKVTAAVGAVFLLVGIAGFIPGITTDYGDMAVGGPESEAMLLGIFQVSILHNIVHLAFGVLGLAAAKAWSSARLFLVGGGVTYLALWLYGLAIDKDSDANFVPLNTADDWLHFALGVGMIALGALLWNGRPARSGAARNTASRNR